MNPFYFNLGLGLIMAGALLFLYYLRLSRRAERDLLAEVRKKDREALQDV